MEHVAGSVFSVLVLGLWIRSWDASSLVEWKRNALFSPHELRPGQLTPVYGVLSAR